MASINTSVPSWIASDGESIMQKAASVGVSTESGRLAVLLAQLSDNHDKERRKAHIESFKIAELKLDNAVARANEIRSGAIAQLVGTAVGSAMGIGFAGLQGAVALKAAGSAKQQLTAHDNKLSGLTENPAGRQASTQGTQGQSGVSRDAGTGVNESAPAGSQGAHSRASDREDAEAPDNRSDLDRAQAEGDRTTEQQRAYEAHMETRAQLSNSVTQLNLNVAQAIGMMGNSFSQISNSVGELVKSGHDADRTILEGANEAISSYDKVNSDNMSYHTETSSKTLDISSNIIRSLMA